MKKKSVLEIAQLYAKSFFDAALEKDALEKAFADAEALLMLLSADDVVALSNPLLDRDIQKDIISEISKKAKFSKEMKNLLDTLVENNRIDALFNILHSFKSLYYKEKDIVEVMVDTVQELDKTQQDKLAKALEKCLSKNVVVSYNIQPEILGGLRVKYGTYQIDDSVLGKLRQIETVMKGEG